MISNLYKTLLAVCLVAGISGCEKEETEPEPKFGKVKMSFKNTVDGSDLVLHNYIYNNGGMNQMRIHNFKYFISNVKLTSATGNYVEPNSYHLVDASFFTTLSFELENVPVGAYTGISFMIGVDGERYASGPHEGIFAPKFGMYDPAIPGYVNVMFEGQCPSSQQMDDSVIFHIRGTEGANNTLRPFTVNFGADDPFEVKGTNQPYMNFEADAVELFDDPYTVDPYLTSYIKTEGSTAEQIADNYSKMIKMTLRFDN